MLIRSLPLWLLLAIVPDVWAVNLRPLLVDRPVQDTSVLAAEAPVAYLDCSSEETIAKTKLCLESDTERSEANPTVVFV